MYNIVCDGLSVFAWVFAIMVKVQIPRVAGKKSFLFFLEILKEVKTLCVFHFARPFDKTH